MGGSLTKPYFQGELGIVAGDLIPGFLFGVNGKLTPVQWSFDDGLPKEHGPATWVTLMIGDGPGLDSGDGTEPYISLWDDRGKRVGQHWANLQKKIAQGNDLKDNVYKIPHIQHRDPMVTPQYLMLSQFDDDAICLAAVQVSNSKLSAVWYGDLGAHCGARWFFSKRQLGDNLMHPKCVWLDADGSEGTNTRAISFHINDMLGTPDKLNMYEESQKEYLCHSTPRFSYWHHLLPDGRIPFFEPPLEYERDALTGLEGRDKDPGRAVDNVKWDKAVWDGPKVIGSRRSVPPLDRNSTRPRLSKREGFNHDPSRLIVTESEDHAASIVCNSTTSYGWDVVSLQEKKYCDMTVKKLYNICDAEIKENCFDMERKALVGHGGVNARGEASAIGVPAKVYSTTDHWK